MSVNRNLVLGFVVSCGLATAIFFLPKSVVNSTKKLESAGTEEKKSDAPMPEEMHKTDEATEGLITDLKQKAEEEKDGTKRSKLYEQLAATYLKNHQYDSAGTFYERASTLSPDSKLLFEAGSAFYEGIAFAGNPSKIEYLSGKARDLLGKVPEKDSKYAEAQAKTAMTWVNSESPMKGILKLRELAEKNPDNQFIAFQLGMLSFQSGQYEKAVARFRKVLSLEKGNVNAWFYLAQSLQQLGKTKEALEAVESGIPLAKEEDTKASFEEMKKQLTEN